MRYCFVFVCQAGELEIKALLLAASLKRHLRGDYELVAAIPAPESEWGEVSSDTLKSLAAMGVAVQPIRNPVGRSYPIGNKIACLSVSTRAHYRVFLDSDMLCMRPFSPQTYLSALGFYAKPADLRTFGVEDGVWQAVYECCGALLPSQRVLASVSGEIMPPYFNAGMIAVRTGSGFASLWRECALAIDADPAVENKRPWLDQVALPVALVKAGIDWACLDERFNYPLHLKPLAGQPAPFFCHYHTPDVLRAETEVSRLARVLTRERPALAERIRQTPEWQRLLLSPQTSARSKDYWPFSYLKNKTRMLPQLLITGIPRSGTSYLCSLLHRIPDVVALNEPAEIFGPLQTQPVPWGVATYYRVQRMRILDGLPIHNKLMNGRLVDDTVKHDEVGSYHPQVGRPDFLLCTKNTLTYLARIQHLRQAMPHTSIVVCVRHPLDAVASWKASFDHLREARVEGFPVGGSRDRLMPMHELARLRVIEQADNQAIKRALLWEHLAALVVASRQDVLLIRYEELVSNPRNALRSILDLAGGRRRFRIPKISPSKPRSKRENLTDEDVQAVQALCPQPAAELGYDLSY